VGRDAVAQRAARLERIAREECGVLRRLGVDVERMGRAVGCAEANPPRVGRRPHRPGEDEVVETEQSVALAERPLRRLHGERIRAPAPVAVEVDPARGKRSEQARDVGRLDAPVVGAVRQGDDVAREAVPADMRRLPRAAERLRVADRVEERATLACAALLRPSTAR